MRLTRCFCPEPLQSGAVVALPRGAAAHLTRVLRLRAGADLTLFDGRGGEYAAQLVESGRDGVCARVGEHRCVERETSVRMTLLQCVARAERMDWIVQKATELGVARIVPIAAAHSVVRVDDAGAARRLAHWRAVAIGACEQCGRNRLPEVQSLCDLTSACREATRAAPAAPPADAPRESVRLVLWPDAPVSLPAALDGVAGRGRNAPGDDCDAPELYLLVGPEGGLAQSELDIAHSHGFRACRLGPRILRSETAPLAAIAAIQATLGDFL